MKLLEKLQFMYQDIISAMHCKNSLIKLFSVCCLGYYLNNSDIEKHKLVNITKL